MISDMNVDIHREKPFKIKVKKKRELTCVNESILINRCYVLNSSQVLD